MNSETPSSPKRPAVTSDSAPPLPTAPKPRLSPITPQSDVSPRVETESKSPVSTIPFFFQLPRESEEPANPEPRGSPNESEPRGSSNESEPRESPSVSQFPPKLPPNSSESASSNLPPKLPPKLPPELPPKLPPRPPRRSSASTSVTAGNLASNCGNVEPEINAVIYPKPSRHVDAPPRHVDDLNSHVTGSHEMRIPAGEKHSLPWNGSSVFLNPADVTIAGNRCSLRNMTYEMDVVEMGEVPRFSESELSREKEFWSRLYHPSILRVPKFGGIYA